jgi:hypothetical protein
MATWAHASRRRMIRRAVMLSADVIPAAGTGTRPRTTGGLPWRLFTSRKCNSFARPTWTRTCPPLQVCAAQSNRRRIRIPVLNQRAGCVLLRGVDPALLKFDVAVARTATTAPFMVVRGLVNFSPCEPHPLLCMMCEAGFPVDGAKHHLLWMMCETSSSVDDVRNIIFCG